MYTSCVFSCFYLFYYIIHLFVMFILSFGYYMYWWFLLVCNCCISIVRHSTTIDVYIICLFTVGFHNFNLRTFNLKVSNPNKLIVDVFVDTMSDFNVPGSRPKKKHDETSEIDRVIFSQTLWRRGGSLQAARGATYS